MKLSVLPETMSVLKLDSSKALPQWALKKSSFVSITYTNEELSIVCAEEAVPSHVEDMEISDEWRCIKVEGPLDFSLTGILSSLISPLAEAEISIFAISTFNTDYLLVKSTTLERTLQILAEHGHFIS
ncbi:hypothetical protein GPDM_02350 [Planococcus donghaensis MPA1U2]|uniref:Uncharacterized protein n=1 Tax=Planococcus donghaensis MPA1U2 TaxID=933115 RepID=E7RDE2_9BACL|nr:ACT domain-containing protein [Planococcus donghaensis]EGA90946.1 hypothetical protein GPDM_02350 [Planococcus donghaensis MPA1U2]